MLQLITLFFYSRTYRKARPAQFIQVIFFSNKILHKAGKKDLVVLIAAMEGGNEVLRPLRFGTNYFGGKSDFHIHLQSQQAGRASSSLFSSSLELRFPKEIKSRRQRRSEQEQRRNVRVLVSLTILIRSATLSAISRS